MGKEQEAQIFRVVQQYQELKETFAFIASNIEKTLLKSEFGATFERQGEDTRIQVLGQAVLVLFKVVIDENSNISYGKLSFEFEKSSLPDKAFLSLFFNRNKPDGAIWKNPKDEQTRICDIDNVFVGENIMIQLIDTLIHHSLFKLNNQ